MPYKYLDDIATADVAFKAWGITLEEMLSAAVDATVNVMIEELDSISFRKKIPVSLENKDLDMLLFQFLQELVYFKDAQGLLLRVLKLQVVHKDNLYILKGSFYGEVLNANKHKLHVDIKAVTLHQLSAKKVGRKWEATAVLDI